MKHSVLRLHLVEFVVIITLLLTKYPPHSHKVATDANAMSPKYNVHHIMVRASSLCGRKIFDSMLFSCLKC